MLSGEEAQAILDNAEQLCSAAEVAAAISRVAGEVSAQLAGRRPLVLAVMSGAVVFAGQLLPLLPFPLDFDYLHASRYDGATGGGALRWLVEPREHLAGRTLLVVDDILDAGITLAAIRERLLARGAATVYTAVLVEKELGREKPVAADFVGLRLPDRYLFGCGMDIHGVWRNLPAIYALKETPRGGCA
ncbi:MAG TPA: hypoxanthine-guanine phosphoribosyltransferase [Rhodocyclaceae bacterium]|nr:hypoxanthine-guanine phosphoribosyltransferase [Rhodocyclaceae bacterium]